MQRPTMKSGFTSMLILLVVCITVAAAMDPRHTPWRGCNCQCGGERGGHCHCADHQKLPNTFCRHGGNHWICFPFSSGNDCSRHGIFWPWISHKSSNVRPERFNLSFRRLVYHKWIMSIESIIIRMSSLLINANIRCFIIKKMCIIIKHDNWAH